MRGFQCGQNSFQPRTDAESLQRFRIRNIAIAHPPRFAPVTMFRADARIIQTRRDGVNGGRLAVGVLQYVAEAAVQNARLPETQRGRMIAHRPAPATRFDADNFDAGVFDERIKHPGRVAAAADAGDDDIGQAADLFDGLLASFPGR